MNTTSWRKREEDRKVRTEDAIRAKKTELTTTNFPVLTGLPATSTVNPVNGFADKVRKLREDDERRKAEADEINRKKMKEDADRRSYFVYRPAQIDTAMPAYESFENMPSPDDDEWRQVSGRKSTRSKPQLSEYEQQLKIDKEYANYDAEDAADREYNTHLSHGRRDHY